MFAKADAYERFMGRWSRLLAPALVTFCEARPGDTVLDVGSGTGSVSFALCDAIETLHVTGVDPSPDYVRHAAELREAQRARFVVGDAQALAFPNAAFDRTVSALVLNFIPDRARALREMTRVTKPGGIVTAAVWDYADGMQMLRVFWDEAIAFDPAIEPRDEAHMPLCRSGELAALWTEAGLQDVRPISLTVALHFASFDDYWAPFLLGQGPAGAYVADLPGDRQRALEQRLRRRLIGDGTDRPFEMSARAWAVKGTVRQG